MAISYISKIVLVLVQVYILMMSSQDPARLAQVLA
jgi:hypothetical protein